MRSHPLRLNTIKTVPIWCGPSRRRRLSPDGDFRVDVDQFKPVSDASNLGVFVNGAWDVICHMSVWCTRIAQYEDGYHPLRWRCSIRVLSSFFQSFSVFFSRLDYCHVVFAGLPISVTLMSLVPRSKITSRDSRDVFTTWSSQAADRGANRVQAVANSISGFQGNAPRYLANHVVLSSSKGQRGWPACDLRTLSRWKCRKFAYRLVTEFFSVAGPRAWNILPIHVIHVCSDQSMCIVRKPQRQ